MDPKTNNANSQAIIFPPLGGIVTYHFRLESGEAKKYSRKSCSSCRKNKNSLFQFGCTKWHKIYDSM
jgi:hypothetical protein